VLFNSMLGCPRLVWWIIILSPSFGTNEINVRILLFTQHKTLAPNWFSKSTPAWVKLRSVT